MNNNGNKSQFSKIEEIIELAGYQIISIGAEHIGYQFTGIINLQIAPAKILEQTDFFNFP